MKALFQELLKSLQRGEDAVLCTIIAASGSAPRGNGAKMAVFADGHTAGTVGGGEVEYLCTRQALEALKTGAAFTRAYCLDHNEKANIGMICGGSVTVYFCCLSGKKEEHLALLSAVCGAFEGRGADGRTPDTWLVTEVTENGPARMGLWSADPAYRALFGMPEEVILPLIGPRSGRSEGDPGYYAEPLTRSDVVYVFGGGHVSRELVPLLAHLGFACVVYEDRAAFADPKDFPGVCRTILADYGEIGSHITITPADYAVILTRGHLGDYIALEYAMGTPASYIGIIGSRKKIAATNEKLLAAGFKEEELTRIHTPIGLPIGAETPAEIAVSIAAELIAHRARSYGEHKKI